MPQPKSKTDLIRSAAEADLVTFIKLVAPHRLLGSIHEELIAWWNRQGASSHQLVLLPRDHGKSAMLAYRCAWEITRDPTIRILYISSTSNLAEKQLKMIKDILMHPIYRRYWPDMVNLDEGKREKWTNSEIAVDHPLRREEGIRDSTVFTGGLTTSLTGLHCDIACLDDVVVQENAYTEDGREKVTQQYSLLASIEAADAREWVVGTRYHPRDLYSDLTEMSEDIYDTEGNVRTSKEVYEVFSREVENMSDGTGEFLWPRQQRHDGKWFGFNQEILARKRAQYLDKTQFFAQYYNNPNKYETSVITPELFQYYDRGKVYPRDGIWQINGKRLNIYASIDFAFTTGKKSDFTAIVVIGVDPDGNIYVLDVHRMKTEKISDMFNALRDLHIKWDFRKVRAEVVAAQKTIVRELKDQYIKPHGLSLTVEEFTPSRHTGNKEERMLAVLEPRYANGAMWHYKGGHMQTLEEELVNRHPAHDDLMDALASAIEIAVPPRHARVRTESTNVVYDSRFGGVARNAP